MAIDFHGFPLRIDHHEASISAMPDEFREGRNLRDGYLRGCGSHFGNLQDLCKEDKAFQEAYYLAKYLGSPVSDYSLVNLYLLLRYYLPKLASGHIVEFGTHRGGSALFFSRLAREYLPEAKIYCFDSFAGLPQESPNDAHRKGDFSDHTEVEFMQVAEEASLNNLVVCKGFFSDTVPRLLPPAVALAHIDCDLYQSVCDAYEGVKGHLVPRAYLVFDDPLFSSCIGAFDAVAEKLIRRDGLKPEQVWPNLLFRGAE